MRSSILVGGQAVINGVMMRVPGAYATAVRIQDGSIKSKAVSFTSLSEKNKFLSENLETVFIKNDPFSHLTKKMYSDYYYPYIFSKLKDLYN